MRKALSLVIDRRMLAEEFFHGYFEPTINLLNYASPFYKQTAIPHEPELARRLAAEVLAGKSAMVEILLSSGPQNYPYNEISVYLQSVMAELGLAATIRMVEKGAFRPTLKNGDYDVYVRRQGLPNGEALGILNDYMRLEGTQGMNPSTQNKTYHYGYSNAAVEQMLDKAQATLDLAERASIYHDLQEIAAQELPVIPLLNERTLVVYNKAIAGFEAMIYGATLPNAHWVK
jgi:peptide/nickel transport system substrate-binding protein